MFCVGWIALLPTVTQLRSHEITQLRSYSGAQLCS